jgi:hypothetical protein
VSKRLSIFVEFVRTFVRYAMHIREVLVSLMMLIAFGGVVFSRLEDVRLGDAIYFAFITGLSIGYGDITPKSTAGQIVSVAIGFVGVLFMGLSVAVATRAMADTAKRHLDSQS